MFRRWFGRKRSGSGDSPAGGPRQPGALDLLMTETLARHFADARVDGTVAWLGFGDVRIECDVQEPSQSGGQWAVPLFLYLSGGRLGVRPIFASISGYHPESAEQAVIEGTCRWACSFGPVLVSALTGAEDPEVEYAEVVIGGRRERLVYASLDRAMTVAGADEAESLVEQVRGSLGGDPHLTPQVLDALPGGVLADREVNLLSLFVLEGFGERTVEVKVNGVDTEVAWPAPAIDPLREGGLALLRELALVVPLEQSAQHHTP